MPISRKRNYRVRTWLSEQEYARYMALVEKSGVSKEQLLRQLLAQGYIRQPAPVEYNSLIAEVNKIGVNINQIARIANGTQAISPASISEIKQMQQKLMRLVKEALG